MRPSTKPGARSQQRKAFAWDLEVVMAYLGKEGEIQASSIALFHSVFGSSWVLPQESSEWFVHSRSVVGWNHCLHIFISFLLGWNENIPHGWLTWLSSLLRAACWITLRAEHISLQESCPVRQGRVIPLTSEISSACTCLFVARCCQRGEPQCGELPVDWADCQRTWRWPCSNCAQPNFLHTFFVLVIVSSNDQLLTI